MCEMMIQEEIGGDWRRLFNVEMRDGSGKGEILLFEIFYFMSK